MGRDGYDVDALANILNFYSHALVGRDMEDKVFRSYEGISTHTPSWGVTSTRNTQWFNDIISTHTPSWGVTDTTSVSLLLSPFLLTRPRGA